MDSIGDSLNELKKEVVHLWKDKRNLLNQIISVIMIVLSALMIWKSCIVIFHNESPIVVVLSGSMIPAMARGDILALNNNINRTIVVGDIVVYHSSERSIPIVHRVLNTFDRKDKNVREFLTKGDNNAGFDQPLYGNRDVITRDDIIGVVATYLPYGGMVTIILNDYPLIKYGVLAFMGILVLTGRDT